jgi:hypothetical protein
MSSSNQDTKLAYWLPKLEVYRAAMDAVPEVEAALPAAAELEVVLAVSDVAKLTEVDGAFYEAKPEIAAEAIDSDEAEVSVEADTADHGFEEVNVAVPQVELAVEQSVEGKNEAPSVEMIRHVPALVVYAGEESTRPSHGSESRATRLSSATLPHVLHLPIDGILKKIKGLKPFVLGIGTVGKSEPQWTRQVVRDAVNRCCDKTGRKAILVTVRPSGYSDGSVNATTIERIREVSWTYFGDSKVETKAWHSQLADLPKWRKDFGLIVFDLGDVRLPTMPRIGRLCDGIVVQLLNAADSRETIQALKSLQNDRLKILGVWSVELNARSIAA